MSSINKTLFDPWPELPYDKFKSTSYLLHMSIQMLGKLKLATPFEPHWANVALWITSQGLTTGPIPYQAGTFTIEIDFLTHHVSCSSSRGKVARFALMPMSVAEFSRTLFNALRHIEVETSINPKPQEVSNPILFNEDTEKREYVAGLANAWWRILANTHCIMQRYHARFAGMTPPVGLMWGTLDIRDARYKNTPVATTGMNAGYIRRNAMDVAQVEAGWWGGNEQYQKPAYYSFTYPQPAGIDQAKIQPGSARWDKTLSEFILDYDDVRKSKHPEQDLLAFLDTTYQAGAALADWDPKLITSGEPV
jgi:hypothetical protein